MIGISKLYCGTVEPSDALRYGEPRGKRPSQGMASERKPVVVWNCTRACNLKCLHCYAKAGCQAAPDEMSHAEGRGLIDDLAAFGVPVLLFSGGEPLCRADLPELADYAAAKGLRTVISTNGTRITEAVAQRLKNVGLAYVGISLDGLQETNDRFRGHAGAFEDALAGIRACQGAGLKVGLRFTISRHNVGDVPGIFALLEAMDIPRVCFYHLVYSGRGKDMMQAALTPQETRQTVALIMDRTADLHKRGMPKEVLTVDNHCDGPYVYLRLLQEGRVDQAEHVMKLLERNGGNSSGSGIGCVGWDGTVYPDPFLREVPVGNVRERAFSHMWFHPAGRVLGELRNKALHVTGRCKTCRFLAVCGGNFRARALAATGTFWGVDPACYLTDEEIAG